MSLQVGGPTSSTIPIGLPSLQILGLVDRFCKRFSLDNGRRTITTTITTITTTMTAAPVPAMFHPDKIPGRVDRATKKERLFQLRQTKMQVRKQLRKVVPLGMGELHSRSALLPRVLPQAAIRLLHLTMPLLQQLQGKSKTH